MAGPLELSIRTPPGGARRLLVLHPGIFSTPAFFAPLVPALLERGSAVVSYDPRGMGRNADRPGPVDTAARVADLLDVITRVSAEHDLPVDCLGHSFGGRVLYLALLDAQRAALPWWPRVGRVVTLASPARLCSRPPASRWADLFSERTIAITDGLQRDGWITPAAFVIAQGQVSRAWFDRPLRADWLARFAQRVVDRGLAQAAVSRLAARLALALPFPSTLLYARGDFTAAGFQEFVRSGALQRDAAALVRELIRAGMGDSEVGAAFAALERPALTVASPRDALVTPQEAAVPGAVNAVLSDAAACGHAGYTFKAATRAEVMRLVGGFLSP